MPRGRELDEQRAIGRDPVELKNDRAHPVANPRELGVGKTTVG